MGIKKLLIGLVVLACTIGQAQEAAPGAPQKESILISGATIHQGNGKEIQDGAVGFRNGVIDYVGSSAAAKPLSYDKVIDAKNQHLYPGFIAVNSTLGLVEIGAVRASRDEREVGYMNPHVRSLIAYNSESHITSTVRTNGVLLGQITPRGGRIPGQSSVMQFDAWSWKDAVVATDEGLHVQWPRTQSWNWKERKMKANEKYGEQVQELKDYMNAAKAYCIGKKSPTDLRREATCKLFGGQQTIYIHANRAKEMQSAINFCRDLEVKKICIVGGYDAPHLIGPLKDNNVSILLRRIHSMPIREDDAVDLPYRLPSILQENGILFALDNSGDMEQMNTRNLPFYAGTSIAYGLNSRDALKSITLNAAKILGIDDRYGSVEMGKQATLFVSSGDALDMRTNDVTSIFIDGRQVSLDNHQNRKYQKFKAKYAQ